MDLNCVLCFNYMAEDDSLQLEQCYSSNVAGYDIIRDLFSFSEQILNADSPRTVCKNCWSTCEAFHDFYQCIANNYGVVQQLADVKVKSEVVLEEEDAIVWEECLQDYDEQNLNFDDSETYSDDEVIEHRVRRKRKKIKNRNSDSSSRLSLIDPADDEKIKQFASMFCEVCLIPLESMANATAHYKKKHNIKGYLKCCGRKFTQRYRLIDHVNTHLNISYICTVCGKKFDTKQYLRNHMVHHEDDKQFQCDKCGKNFAKKFLIKNHMQTVHAFDNVEPTFACHYAGCEKVYVNAVRLKHHIKYSHENVDKEICEICSKTFSLKNSLDEHMKIHTRRPEDRFKCEICGHFISDRKTFNKHVKNHETEGLDNTCHYCGKKSPNLNALRRHVKYVHETIPTHQCRFCEKAFKRPRDLLDHTAAIHTHQELYECTFCQKTFRNQSNMLSHRKKEHPDHYVKPAYMRDS